MQRELQKEHKDPQDENHTHPVWNWMNEFDEMNLTSSSSSSSPPQSDSAVQETVMPTLTEELLRAHTLAHEPLSSLQHHSLIASPLVESTTNMNMNMNMNMMERRQFNCPQCPKRGRGKYVFFKRVPAYKPIAKCPQCKIASGGGNNHKMGDCTRLYALPKVAEKGYGLFKCTEFHETWGSSRAIGHIGQECYNCKTRDGKMVYVKPFRLEVVKNHNKMQNNGTKSGNTAGGGGRTRMRRVPKQPIGETEETHVGYTKEDVERNQNNAENALVASAKKGRKSRKNRSSGNGGGGGGGENGGDGNGAGGGGGENSGGGGNGNVWESVSMFIFMPPTDSTNQETESTESSSDPPPPPVLNDNHVVFKKSPLIKVGVPPGYVHHCEGCASGLCKSRYLPMSLYHDESDGDTVSTRASVVTNSSVDKTEYVDRDEDFSFYEDMAQGWEIVRSNRRRH